MENIDEIVDEIIELVRPLYDLWKEYYRLLEPAVLYVINSKSQNSYLIESYLDDLLNIPTDESYELLQELCAYYSTIDKESADFYLETWNKMWEDEIEDELEKQKIKSI